MVHTDAITQRSPFFRAAFAHNFKETLEKRIRLPECDRETFNLYLQYTYQGFEKLPAEAPSLDECEAIYHLLFKLYVLADQLQDHRLCNATLDRLIDTARVYPSPATIQLVYDTFPRAHKIRSFVVALCMDECSRFWLDDNRDALPTDFIVEFAMKCSQQLAESWFDLGVTLDRYVEGIRKCEWHEHNGDIERAECGKKARG